jgi:hypothetical protein
MARSNLVFGVPNQVVEVEGEPKDVISAMGSGWARLNRASEGSEDWIWVNSDNVLFVEPAGSPRSTHENFGLKSV